LKQALVSDRNLSGLYNLAASGETSWHGFAVYLVAKARKLGWDLKARPENIKPAPAAALAAKRPARRPSNSRLSTDRLNSVFGLRPPHWTYYVDRLLWLWTSIRNLSKHSPLICPDHHHYDIIQH
jgi:dTDP-4-dehydrorhamnose reductase